MVFCIASLLPQWIFFLHNEPEAAGREVSESSEDCWIAATTLNSTAAAFDTLFR
jgi:hypothetical protein